MWLCPREPRTRSRMRPMRKLGFSIRSHRYVLVILRVLGGKGEALANEGLGRRFISIISNC